MAIARFLSLVVDCPDPRELATFYERLLGLERVEDTDDWVTLEGGARMCFQRVESFVPPRWPDPAAPQQMHVDVLVDDLDVAEPRVLALGATLLEGSDKPIGFRVNADPIGHPFCLVTPECVTTLG